MLVDYRTGETQEGQMIGTLESYAARPQLAALGQTALRTDVRSTIGPFHYLPEWGEQYPQPVVDALGNLYAEYNDAFAPLVEANREWATDYQYCERSDGRTANYFVQIDMVGLPPKFLRDAASADPMEVARMLRHGIFEIENSVAMYQLLERIYANETGDSEFKTRFRVSLNALRQRFNMPIALLAVTDQKFAAMRESEFGKVDGEPLTPNEVYDMSGFDAFFGPQEFADHVAARGGRSDYLLYVRSSDPVAKLRDPRVAVDAPLLADPDMRRVIKAHTLTYNVDEPGLTPGDPRRINDTKAYAEQMGIAHAVYTGDDVMDPEFVAHLNRRGSISDFTGPNIFSSAAVDFMLSRGVDPSLLASGTVPLRAKPMQGAYGCYGHHTGVVVDRDFRALLRKGVRERGPYVVQPELVTPTVVNESDGREYKYIDRVWMATDGTAYRFIGAYRSFMPTDSCEAAKGRNHGSQYTVWGEITD